MINSLVVEAKKIGGERFRDLVEATNKKVNPGKTKTEEQLFQNVSLLCEVEEEEGNKGRRAAILAMNLDITHRRSQQDDSMISVAKRKVNQGFSKSPRFVVVLIIIIKNKK